MQIAFKFTFTMTLLVIGILLIEVVLHVRDEEQLLREDIKVDHQLTGDMIRDMLEHTLKHEGETKTLALIPMQEKSTKRANWKIVKFATTEGYLSAAQRKSLQAGHTVAQEQQDTHHTNWVSYWPVMLKGQIRLVLEYKEPINPPRHHLENELYRLLWVNLWIFSLSIILTLIIGYYIVGRPVTQILERFEHVKQGQLESHPVPKGSDEFNRIRHGFENMLSHLSQTKQHLSEAELKQQNMMNQLRRTDRLRSIGTLAAGVAHELGTPLHVIKGRANMIRTEDERTQRHLQIIIEQSDRMQSIVSRLMDLSREQPLVPTRTELNALCAHVVETLDVLARKKETQLMFTAHDTQLYMLIDNNLLEQALINIITNAIFASDKGQTITIRVLKQHDKVAIQVEDHGCGMNKDTLSQALDPFFTTKDVGQGTGLGLAIADGIVNEHGGTLKIQSSVDNVKHGTLITLWLPLNNE